MKKKWLLFAFMILIVIMILTGFANAGEKILNVYSGILKFNNPIYEDKVLLEFPVALKRNEFEFYKAQPTDSLLSGRVYLQVLLIDTSAVAIDSASTYFALEAVDEKDAAAKNIRIFDRLSLLVSPGKYTAKITAIDVVSKNRGEFFIPPFDIKVSENAKLSLSDTYLAYNIEYLGEKADTNFRMVKNGYRIYPNPPSIYSVEDTSIVVYGELYNLDFNPEKKSKYKLIYNVLNQDSSFFMFLGERELEKKSSSAVYVESFDIKGWPSDIYILQVITEDKKTDLKAAAYHPFAIINPIPDKDDKILAKKGNSYDILTLQDKINMINYLLTPEQMRVLKNLNDDGKKNFLNQFWAEHDKDKATAENEMLLDYLERYNYVNDLFSTNTERDNGWLSDRGRIFMTYGPPEEVDDVPVQNIDLDNPIVVWYYRSISEGKYFVFEEIRGINDYKLVHSNVNGEVFNKKWDDIINQDLEFNYK